MLNFFRFVHCKFSRFCLDSVGYGTNCIRKRLELLLEGSVTNNRDISLNQTLAYMRLDVEIED